MLVARALRRHLFHYPWQLALAVVGIAIGVAVVVAVDLATASSRAALRLTTEELAGGATHQIVGGPAGVDERLYVRLRVELGLQACAPLIEAFGEVRGETIQVLGIDPLAERMLRTRFTGVGGADLSALLAEPNRAMLSAATARRLGVKDGAPLLVELGGYRDEVVVVGLLPDAPDGVLFVDIATAQELLRSFGRLSWIDIALPPGPAGARLQAGIQRLLPPGAFLTSAEARRGAMEQLSRAFHTNLTAMSLLALVVGAFLIFTTARFATLQRRQLIARLRLLGATRAQILAAILGETLVLGALGAALGVALGMALGIGVLGLVTRTMTDLYFVAGVTALQISPASLIKGLALGIGTALVAGALPARDAAATRPQAALSRSRLETGARERAPRLAVGGALAAALGLAILAAGGQSLLIAFVALFALILGLTLFAPLIVVAVADALAAPLGRWFGPVVRLALRGIAATLSRTGVAVAALMLAVATAVGVDIMVASFRASVVQWLEATLQADIYVGVPSLRSTRSDAALDPDLIARVRALPSVAEVIDRRSVTFETAQGLVEIRAQHFPRGFPPGYRLVGGRPGAWSAVGAGQAVLISESHAYRHHLHVGAAVELPTAQGLRRLPVAGVFRDYQAGPGAVLMSLDRYAELYRDSRIDGLLLHLTPDADLAATIEAVRTAGRGQALRVYSNRELRQRSLDVFDRTFTVTEVLRLLALVVACAGIVSALLALQLERAAETGVLRAIGFTPGQIGGMVCMQTAYLGAMAGALAVPTGLVLAQVLIHVINRRAFGWSMDDIVPLAALLQAVGLALAAALIAGAYPAWRLARAAPAALLREE